MIEELNAIRLRLNTLAKNITNMENLTFDERDAILQIEVDIFLYVLKNEIKVRKDIGFFISILHHVKNKINRSRIPNNEKIRKLNLVIDRCCSKLN